jgi:hypothetical protein
MVYFVGMAIREIIESDLSGKTHASTVTFGFGNTWYEIDLTEDESQDFEKNLTSYIEHARKAEKAGRGKTKQVPDMTPEEREQIRAWAIENGYEVASFGRVPKKILAAYNEAHKTTDQ